ncbi:hypothetical protein [Streptomyces radicis]|uniref:Integral membrane protein n=1 Tax=Streptomyces radicis TaxID=1750517 RepID=A0A3A9W8D0_9ACTN|nr:hypothetical protein [Streptomyces radicis]RKN09019.1 hypothetical protein D7319_13880 [Streptomyces radicis]RKN22790.1 hypothetical protein D7318_14675 [Streptomyces radicis]
MTGSPDPVRALLSDHRALCERAVDPLEIAAGLEASGVTDRAAARFRHRDVFSLADELFARVTPPERAEGADAGRAPRRRRRAARLLSPLLPGVLCAATVAAALARPFAAVVLAVALAALTLAAARLVLSPLGPPGLAGICALPPVGYALFGDAALAELLPGRQSVPQDVATATALTLAFAAAPTAWCRGWFAVRRLRLLATSRGLREFAAGARPLLAAALALVLAGLLAVQGAARLLPVPGTPGAFAATTALGLLLGLAVLLVGHGRTGAAAAGLAAAGAVELLALALAGGAWLPGCAGLAAPVEALVAAHGTAVVPALACGGAAAALLVPTVRTLTRAATPL